MIGYQQYTSGGAGMGAAAANYFQSNSFSNNPLRKNNELNKARKELLSDSKFLKEQPKLGNFLFAKYLKEVSTDPTGLAPAPVAEVVYNWNFIL